MSRYSTGRPALVPAFTESRTRRPLSRAQMLVASGKGVSHRAYIRIAARCRPSWPSVARYASGETGMAPPGAPSTMADRAAAALTLGLRGWADAAVAG